MGRLAGRPELGKAIMDDLLNMIGDACKIDVPSKQEGKNLFMVIAPNIEK
jgi:translation initiation factor IF-3